MGDWHAGGKGPFFGTLPGVFGSQYCVTTWKFADTPADMCQLILSPETSYVAIGFSAFICST